MILIYLKFINGIKDLRYKYYLINDKPKLKGGLKRDENI